MQKKEEEEEEGGKLTCGCSRCYWWRWLGSPVAALWASSSSVQRRQSLCPLLFFPLSFLSFLSLFFSYLLSLYSPPFFFSFSPLFFFFFSLSVFFFFSLLPTSLSTLSSPVFIGKYMGREAYYPCPIMDRGRVAGVANV